MEIIGRHFLPRGGRVGKETPAMDRSLHTKTLRLGVCYYPEHWPERLWAEDMRRMAAHGISLIRIAEFAWNLIEPQEGVFNFDFFDRVLDCAQAAGMGVVMGTPTATPPALRRVA